MISVTEALDILAQAKVDLGTEVIPLTESLGRFLKSDILADRNIPPYHRVTMDGIAINYKSFESGQRIFKIADISPAGSATKTLVDSSQCIEVMTGTVLPNGTDTIIRYEDLLITDGKAEITIPSIKYKQNIHFEGQDISKGDVAIPKEHFINASAIGLAASVGKATVEVSRMPKVMIISTGDELVDIDQTPLPHQIRKSNMYRLTAALENLNIKVDQAHLADDQLMIKEKLKLYLSAFDIVMMSGGVSKGKFDYLPGVLEELGVNKLFHKIKQKPGKPFWFGQSKKDNCTVFALPGNPVSSFLCMEKYFKFWLHLNLTGSKPTKRFAKLSEDVTYKPALTLFQEVRLEVNDQAEVIAYPCRGNGSGDMSNLVKANAFIELPADQEVHKAGGVYEVILFNP